MGDISAENPAPVEPPSPATEQAVQSPTPTKARQRFWDRFRPRPKPKENIGAQIPNQPSATTETPSAQPAEEKMEHAAIENTATEIPTNDLPPFEAMLADIDKLITSGEITTNLTPEEFRHAVEAFALPYVRTLKQYPELAKTNPQLFAAIAGHMDGFSPEQLDAVEQTASLNPDEWGKKQYLGTYENPTPSGKIRMSREELIARFREQGIPVPSELEQREPKAVEVDPQVMEALRRKLDSLQSWHGREEQVHEKTEAFMQAVIELMQQPRFATIPLEDLQFGLEAFAILPPQNLKLIDNARGNTTARTPQMDHTKTLDTKPVLAKVQEKQAREKAASLTTEYLAKYDPVHLTQEYRDALQKYGTEYASGMPQHQLTALKEQLGQGLDQAFFNQMIERIELALSRPEERNIVPNLTEEQQRDLHDFVDKPRWFPYAGRIGPTVQGALEEYGALLLSGASEKQLGEEWERLTGTEEPIDRDRVIFINGPRDPEDNTKFSLDKPMMRDLLNELRVHYGYSPIKQTIRERWKEQTAG